MKTQYTFTLVTRLLLVLLGFAGQASLMFFKEASPLINWLALATIIPLIMGMLGENLVREIFVTSIRAYAIKNGLTDKITAPVISRLPLPGMTGNMEKNAV